MRNPSNKNKDGLEPRCHDAIGKKLFVGTIYGWGWFGNKESPDPTPPFEFILTELWEYDDILRGGIGKISQSGHPYDGWFLIFSTRVVGTWNFDTKIGHYNTDITKSYTLKDGWPLPTDPNKCCVGYGAIGFKKYMKKSKEFSYFVDANPPDK